MGQNRPFAIALLAFAAWPALAQDIRQKQIRLSAGEPVRLRDTIHGNETIDYRLDAAKGSNLTIAIKTSSPSADFNFYGLIGADGMPDQSIFTGSAMGNNFTGRISESGEYVIRVYLRRNAARPNEEAHFRLDILSAGLPLPTPRPDDNFADGQSGGPDRWRVVGIEAGDVLNIRAAPSARAGIVGRVRNGAVLKNRGCRTTGSTRWCRVEMSNDGVRGWAAGRYLRE